MIRLKRGKWYVYKVGEDYKVFDTLEEAELYENPESEDENPESEESEESEDEEEWSTWHDSLEI